MSSPWLPINTAPRDGTWFLITDQDGRIEAGRYNPVTYHAYEAVGDGLYRRIERDGYAWEGFSNFHRATHWLPVPPPPVSNNEKEDPDAR